MKWDIEKNVRCFIFAYSGIDYSGDRYECRIFPSGRHGDELEGKTIKSIAVVAPVGTRVVLKTTLQDDWESATWRAIVICEGEHATTSEGKSGVQVPDLDTIAKPDALRSNPDVEESYPLCDKLDNGKGWTYGRVGDRELKGGVVAISVGKVPSKQPDES
ncbi:MAG: hypothetical protein ACI9MC_003251 [Kiritimatiellia bacterium]|jgi:hypothetical protein